MEIVRKPDWLKIRLRSDNNYSHVSDIVHKHGLHTICSSGKCPNMGECWSRGTATLMILGNICTRGCKFCATMTGKPLPVETDEPQRVAESVRLMALKYCVITSVDRDDLKDGGSGHWASVIQKVREINPNTGIEVLVPDFDACEDNMYKIVESHPDVVGHNIETVERLTPLVRSKASYTKSLSVINYYSRKNMVTKSGLMLGLGETKTEVETTMRQLVDNGCQYMTIGQYLRPSIKNIAVSEYIHPDVFAYYAQFGKLIGFKHVESAPLVRSSYMAEQAYLNSKEKDNA